MINKISAHLANALIKDNKISSDEFELYHYAFFIIISDLSLLIFSLFWGFIFRIVFESLIFFAVFFILHRFAGGFHAKTELHCQAVTLTSFLLCIAAIKYSVLVNSIYLIAAYIIFCIVLIILSPSDTPQKELGASEKIKFKKITAVLVVICSVIITILFFFNSTVICANSIILAVILEAVSVIFGRLFNKRLLSNE